VVVSKQFVQRHLDMRAFTSNLLELKSSKSYGGCCWGVRGCVCGAGEPFGDLLLSGEGNSDRCRACCVSFANIAGSRICFRVIGVMGGFG